MNAGMLHIYRETLDTSLRVGVDVLKILGYTADIADRAAKTFLRMMKRRSNTCPPSAMMRNTSVLPAVIWKN
ncbi:hypothetical protein [Paraflavitalea speifideaquila]|uniref:hypothetical protein n=1 Tax=Paraflavitalea speifideaquila TaxID=3076558 RepID=UPI0028E38855|nr:hypothetical protein [Paraflavitalea speifideiaquila]